jgi:hypothetical protein
MLRGITSSGTSSVRTLEGPNVAVLRTIYWVLAAGYDYWLEPLVKEAGYPSE